jgi:hypothetical protein
LAAPDCPDPRRAGASPNSLSSAGAAKKVAPRLLAAEIPQRVELFCGFDPLRDRPHSKALGQVDDRPQRRPRSFPVTDILDELTIDFECVDGIHFEMAEARVAGGKIVNANPHAHRPDLLQLLDDSQAILHQHRLCDFDVKAMRREPRFGKRVPDGLCVICAFKLRRGRVDGNIDARRPGRYLHGRAIEDPRPNFDDQPELVGRREVF